MSKPRKKKTQDEQEVPTPDPEIRESESTDAAKTDAAAADGPAEPAEPAVAEEIAAEEERPADPLETLRRERDQFQEKWLRSVAELDNVRKRSRREVADSRRFARADVLRPFLEMHDNFERALQSFAEAEDTAGDNSVQAGIELIHQRFQGILKDLGVEAIPARDQEFDPRVHEAVGQLAREGVEAGIVVEVVQEGFLLGDLVLRPARVIVAG